ncbi:unnamed protein product [Bathycoccus prasinos]
MTASIFVGGKPIDGKLILSDDWRKAGEKRRRPEEDFEANDTNQDPKTLRHYAAAVYTIVNGEKKRVK